MMNPARAVGFVGGGNGECGRDCPRGLPRRQRCVHRLKALPPEGQFHVSSTLGDRARAERATPPRMMCRVCRLRVTEGFVQQWLQAD
jgi:hypothetical protein